MLAMRNDLDPVYIARHHPRRDIAMTNPSVRLSNAGTTSKRVDDLVGATF